MPQHVQYIVFAVTVHRFQIPWSLKDLNSLVLPVSKTRVLFERLIGRKLSWPNWFTVLVAVRRKWATTNCLNQVMWGLVEVQTRHLLNANCKHYKEANVFCNQFVEMNDFNNLEFQVFWRLWTDCMKSPLFYTCLTCIKYKDNLPCIN
jgi:hypothetical protein